MPRPFRLLVTRRLRWLPLLLVAAAAPARARQDAAPATNEHFSDERLEEIAAPVALYPDPLLMQVFMASTYPLEIVEAQRWVEKNKLTGDALDEALKGQDWDPSVKSLCSFPDVLKRMSDNLDWTRDMGDAFLEQQSALLDAVQRLRDKAYQAGQLKTTEQQTVTVQPDKIIVIEPANPQVIYVPTYSPTVVYGAWPYPTMYYRPLYAPPPPGYGALAFTTGMFVGAALWGDCHWGWGHSECNININNYNSFNRVTNNNFTQVNNNKWQHNAEHRKGVNYRDSQTARKYGGATGQSRVTRAEARGFESRPGGRGGAAPATTDRGRSATPRTGEQRGGASPRTGGARGGASPRTGGGAAPRTGATQGGWSGSRNPSFDKAASSRGRTSRGSSGGAARPSRSAGGGRR